MKRLIIAGLLLSVPLVMGCEKMFYNFLISFPVSKTFEVDQPGSFGGNATYSVQDINDALDKPGDTEVPDNGISIESLSLRIETREGNAATGATVSGTVLNTETSQWDMVFSDFFIPIPDSVGEDTTVVILNLGNVGITTLRQQIEAIVTDDLAASSFQVDFEGDTEPSNQQIVAGITLVIKGTSEVEQCLNAFMSSGESCGD